MDAVEKDPEKAFETWYNKDGWMIAEGHDEARAVWIAACVWMGEAVAQAIRDVALGPPDDEG